MLHMLIRMLPPLIFCLFNPHAACLWSACSRSYGTKCVHNLFLFHINTFSHFIVTYILQLQNRMSQDNVSIIIADLGYVYIWLYALLCCNLKLIQLYDTSSVFNIEYNWNDLVSNDSMLLYEHNHTGRFMNFIFWWIMITPSSPSH